MTRIMAIQANSANTWEQNLFYHGIALRDGKELTAEFYTLESQITHKLRIIRSGLFVPQIFVPNCFFVASERIAKRLERLCNIKLFEVVFERLTHYTPDHCGEEEHEDFTDESQTAKQVFLALSGAPFDRCEIGKYFEVIYGHDSQIDAKYFGRRETVLTFPDGQVVKTMVNGGAFDVYPMLTVEGTCVCRSDVFALMENEIMAEGFQIASTEI